jgi:hypothetical protein
MLQWHCTPTRTCEAITYNLLTGQNIIFLFSFLSYTERRVSVEEILQDEKSANSPKRDDETAFSCPYVTLELTLYEQDIIIYVSYGLFVHSSVYTSSDRVVALSVYKYPVEHARKDTQGLDTLCT